MHARLRRFWVGCVVLALLGALLLTQVRALQTSTLTPFEITATYIVGMATQAARTTHSPVELTRTAEAVVATPLVSTPNPVPTPTPSNNDTISNILSVVVEVLLLLGILVPVGIGAGLSRNSAFPTEHAAGLLTLFPFANLILVIGTIVVVGPYAPAFVGSPYAPAFVGSVGLLIPSIILALFLLAWLLPDMRAETLSGWLWLSTALALAHTLTVPVIWWLLGYGVAYFYDSLDGLSTTEPLPWAIWVILLFLVLPTLASLYNLWMVRRDRRTARS